jgi:hypothetical protein
MKFWLDIRKALIFLRVWALKELFKENVSIIFCGIFQLG